MGAIRTPDRRILAMDETYVKVRGEWVYLYRAVDKAVKTVDFYVSEKRDKRGQSLSA